MPKICVINFLFSSFVHMPFCYTSIFFILWIDYCFKKIDLFCGLFQVQPTEANSILLPYG